MTISTTVWVDCQPCSSKPGFRVVDPELELGGPPLPHEAEVRERGAVEVRDLALTEVLGRDAGIVPADEGLDPLRLVCRDSLARERRDGLDDGEFFLFRGTGDDGHGWILTRCAKRV
ncbi:MAG: hypothetical protein LC647_11795 [Beggiatoa sp.]|nr:hypothetical protein [Beggiatoa sp.]